MSGVSVKLGLSDLQELAAAALERAGADGKVAALLARVHVEADRDGIASHGVARLPGLCAQLSAGRIDGRAVPEVTTPRTGVVVADAKGGFPQPAFEAGFARCLEAVRAHGAAVFIVRNGFAADVMGWHVEQFAQEGMLALGFANVPASISPEGGASAVFGTNPVTCSIPQDGKPPVVIDQASSVVAKSEIVERAAAGKAIPLGWARDSAGRPTEDAKAALAGSMVATGGYKGVGFAFIAEMFSAILSGSELSIEAAPLSKVDADPVRLAQTYVVVDPSCAAGPDWRRRVARVTDAIESQPGARVPGARRFSARQQHERDGVEIGAALFQTLQALAGRL